MLLAIDVGNTNTVFAIYDGQSFLAEWRCATEHARTADQYYVWLRNLMQLNNIPSEIDRVVISSVVPQVVFNLRVLSDKYFDCRPVVVGKPETELGVPVRVDEGTLVGADRLVNTVGAYDRYGGDLIVVDFGTATTFDVVDQDGAYIGGVISPGVNLSIKALHEAAAALPHIDVSMPDNVIGTNTLVCMQAGVFWGYIGLIEGVCKKIREEHPRPMKVIGTGGLAGLFERGTTLFDTIDGDLTLHGLVLIAEKNKGE
ncbi:type III pantothenate kinase [Amylibacter sp. IMCC11727]|uniref:type III pantothenate kinase n=1 Tax=Amylibacter sp. IMCC11727 TaxID=3039851 RepID=UPI00244E17CC|nr:type III pantothenate kinase [Amylibacter sp. IMCC11727]WGI23409.1 type III pantothenate kinase [Amylibacter sp. IMCC11727]